MRKIILDTDPGMDDSAAIIMACKSSDLQLLAVTAAQGNYPVDVTFRNARRVLRLIGREDIPVYRGCEKPMVRNRPHDPFTHGEDGQCNINLPDSQTPPETKHAVNAIIDLVREHPGEITMVCLAPMTNLAMAIRLAPDIVGKIREVIAISGAFGLNEASFLNGTGDNPQSEWNVFVDPEATKLVYESGMKVTAIGLDVATYFDVDFTEDELAQLRESPRPEAQFLCREIDFVHGRGFKSYCCVIDCMAIACAEDDSMVKTMDGLVGVETKDGLTLGMTVMDRRHHHVWQGLPTIQVAVSADYARFLHRLMERFVG
ncbi:MAG: nucleoside hydrolase [Aristaeellaceae bacterium]